MDTMLLVFDASTLPTVVTAANHPGVENGWRS
jgi:hypothetical protein